MSFPRSAANLIHLSVLVNNSANLLASHISNRNFKSRYVSTNALGAKVAVHRELISFRGVGLRHVVNAEHASPRRLRASATEPHQ